MLQLNEWVDDVSGLLSPLYVPSMLPDMAFEYGCAKLASDGYHNVLGKDFYLISDISVINGNYLTVWRDLHAENRL
jgi:hypothetical protein